MSFPQQRSQLYDMEEAAEDGPVMCRDISLPPGRMETVVITGNWGLLLPIVGWLFHEVTQIYRNLARKQPP